MNPLEQLVSSNTISPCNVEEFCRNSPSNSSRTLCNQCRLSPNVNILLSTEHHWKSIDKKHKHPILENEKRQTKREKTIARQAKRKAKDRNRQQVNERAAKAEKRTEREIIKSTVNSGRSNKDGDHLSKGKIALDTKHQSKRDNPIVKLSELDKIRKQAITNGLILGALVLRNKSGRGVIVIDERDWGLL